MSVFKGKAENIENNLNKVSSVDENSTDEQYPSAKVVYDRTKDYIVEQGESDGWVYRKWNSGIAECYGDIITKPVEAGTTGNLYYSERVIITLPEGITATVFNVLLNNFMVWAINSTIDDNSISFRVMRAIPITTEADTRARIIVKGTWK